MTGNDGYWRVHPKSLHETPFQVFHFECVLECGRAVRVTEDLVDFLNNFVLNILVDAHHGQEETASGSCGVVTLLIYKFKLCSVHRVKLTRHAFNMVIVTSNMMVSTCSLISSSEMTTPL